MEKRVQKRSLEDFDPNFTPRRFKRPKSSIRPHWYNRQFFLYLGLQSQTQPVSRTDVIDKAFKINKVLGDKLDLPFLYNGKTPRVGASNLLSHLATDWIQLKGSGGDRVTYFKLPIPPIHLPFAADIYERWCRELATHDWPIYFTTPVPPPQRKLPILEKPTYTSLSDAIDLLETRRRCKSDRVKYYDRMPIPSLDRPKRWSDLVRVTREGVFAIRSIPAQVPIGFYYGAPLTEDEFDALKYREGRAAEFCLMYRRTVLDPTDKEGLPVRDITSHMFCPFHFMNEVDQPEANVLLEESIVPNQIVCWTRREIEGGEELKAWFGGKL